MLHREEIKILLQDAPTRLVTYTQLFEGITEIEQTRSPIPCGLAKVTEQMLGYHAAGRIELEQLHPCTGPLVRPRVVR